MSKKAAKFKSVLSNKLKTFFDRNSAKLRARKVSSAEKGSPAGKLTWKQVIDGMTPHMERLLSLAFENGQEVAQEHGGRILNKMLSAASLDREDLTQALTEQIELLGEAERIKLNKEGWEIFQASLRFTVDLLAVALVAI